MANPLTPDPTKSLPKTADSQIVRVPLDTMDIAGRKDHIPSPRPSPDMGVVHVPNVGSRG